MLLWGSATRDKRQDKRREGTEEGREGNAAVGQRDEGPEDDCSAKIVEERDGGQEIRKCSLFKILN